MLASESQAADGKSERTISGEVNRRPYMRACPEQRDCGCTCDASWRMQPALRLYPPLAIPCGERIQLLPGLLHPCVTTEDTLLAVLNITLAVHKAHLWWRMATEHHAPKSLLYSTVYLK